MSLLRNIGIVSGSIIVLLLALGFIWNAVFPDPTPDSATDPPPTLAVAVDPALAPQPPSPVPTSMPVPTPTPEPQILGLQLIDKLIECEHGWVRDVMVKNLQEDPEYVEFLQIALERYLRPTPTPVTGLGISLSELKAHYHNMTFEWEPVFGSWQAILIDESPEDKVWFVVEGVGPEENFEEIFIQMKAENDLTNAITNGTHFFNTLFALVTPEWKDGVTWIGDTLPDAIDTEQTTQVGDVEIKLEFSSSGKSIYVVATPR